MIITIVGQCHWEDCEEAATHIACGRSHMWRGEQGHPSPSNYCESHAEQVANEGVPEYKSECPNCSCQFGVN